MKRTKAKIDGITSALRQVWEYASATGETTFEVDTADRGKVTVRILLKPDGRLHISAVDVNGKSVAAPYEAKEIAEWCLVLNEVRRFRPRRITIPGVSCLLGCTVSPETSRSPYWITNRSGFEIEEIKMAGVCQGFTAVDEETALLLDYRDGHFVHREQRLTKADLAAFVAIARCNPELLVFFNFLKPAGMTIGEHLHGQVKMQQSQLPIQRAFATMNSRRDKFEVVQGHPAVTLGIDSESERLFRIVDRLQQANQPFNLALLQNDAFLVARTKFVSDEHLPGLGLASLETLANTLIFEEQRLVQENGVFVWDDVNLSKKMLARVEAAMKDVSLSENELKKFID